MHQSSPGSAPHGRTAPTASPGASRPPSPRPRGPSHDGPWPGCPQRAGPSGRDNPGLPALTTQVNGLSGDLVGEAGALASVERLDNQVAELTAAFARRALGDDAASYQPSAQPR